MFAATSIVTTAEGVIGFWVQTTDFGLDSVRKCFGFTAETGFPVRFHLTGAGSGSTDVTVYTNDGRTGQATIATSGVAMASGSKYFVMFEWKDSTNYRKVSAYNSSLALINANTDSSTNFTIDGTPSEIWIGNSGSWRGYIDNVFIADSVADADTIVANANITSYTEYGGGGGGSSASTKTHFHRMLRSA